MFDLSMLDAIDAAFWLLIKGLDHLVFRGAGAGTDG